MGTFAASIALALSVACGGSPTDEHSIQAQLASMESQPFITTDRASYEAETGDFEVGIGPPGSEPEPHTIWYVEFTIQMTYTNQSDDPVHINVCGEQAYAPRLERLVDGRWQTAYRPPQRLCGGPYLRIDPGESYNYEFRVRGHDPEKPVRPHWLPDEIDGTYRVNWGGNVLTAPDVRAEPVPLEQRISNTFHVSGSSR